MVLMYLFSFIFVMFFKEMKAHSITRMRDPSLDLVAFPKTLFFKDCSQASAPLEAQFLITHCHTRMMTFIDENSFNSNAFVRSAEELHGLMLEAEKLVQIITPSNTTILQQLKYVKLIYRTLLEAVEILGYFNLSHPAQHLLRYTVHMNLHLLSMHNTKGLPKVPRAKFVQVQSRLRRDLKLWRSIFKKCPGVPRAVKSIFRGQYNRAVRTLQSMAQHYSQ